jgi:hypothetical protein
MMDEMRDINWQSDIRQVIEEMVREKKREKLLAEARELRKGTKNIGISASELIREDRDATWLSLSKCLEFIKSCMLMVSSDLARQAYDIALENRTTFMTHSS